MQTVIADNSNRIKIPDAKPAQVFNYTVNPDGGFTLTPVKQTEPPTHLAKLVMKDGVLMMDIPEGYTLVEDSIAQAIAEVRNERLDKIGG